jgi:hypothetical protein
MQHVVAALGTKKRVGLNILERQTWLEFVCVSLRPFFSLSLTVLLIPECFRDRPE